MPRPSNTKLRRAEIVEGLMRAMSASGYERASIKQIAREAGVASGVVHYHFDNKLEILVALTETLSERVRARISPPPDATPHERLDALIDAHLALGEGADPRAVAAWVAIGVEAVSQPEVAEVYRAAVARTLDELEELLREGGADDPSAGAAVLLAAIEGAYQLSAAAPGLLPEGYAAPMVRRLARTLLPGNKSGTG